MAPPVSGRKDLSKTESFSFCVQLPGFQLLSHAVADAAEHHPAMNEVGIHRNSGKSFKISGNSVDCTYVLYFSGASFPQQ